MYCWVPWRQVDAAQDSGSFDALRIMVKPTGDTQVLRPCRPYPRRPASYGLMYRRVCRATLLMEVVEELREFAHGIHQAVLTEGGLGLVLRVLARRSALSAKVDVRTVGRLPVPIEVGAYYVVSEALTNTAKHLHAFAASGLVGLKDRIEALGGSDRLASPVWGTNGITTPDL